MTQKLQARSITADNQFTDSVELTGHFNISISGTWDAQVTVQRSFDKGSTWYDVAEWEENTQEYGLEVERGVYYRAGIKPGEYSQGTCAVRLSQ